MRLRFGRPSLPVLMLFAAIIGAVFYFYDNRNPLPATDATSRVTPAPTEFANIAIDPTPLSTTAPTTQFNSNRVQSIPQDTSIFVPTVGIISNVIQAYLNGTSWDVSQLRSNAGHLEGTPWVNQPGNVVISGHVELSTGALGVFGALERITIGDTITVMSEGIEYTYQVTEIYNTQPTDLQPIMPTTDDRLTLITCNSYDIITNAYSERLIVVALRVS